MKKVLSLLLVLLLLGTLAGCSKSSGDAPKQPAKEQPAQAEKPAQPEKPAAEEKVTGKIKLYTSEPQDLVNEMMNDFKAKNPGVEVEIFRSGTGNVISKLDAEMQAGKAEADVIWFADIDYFRNLASKGLLEEHKSEEAKNIDARYTYEGGKYYEVRQIFNVIGYNTSKVKNPPKTWTDLASSEFKSKAAVANPNYSGAAFITLATLIQDEAIGWKFFENLKANDVKFEQSNGNLSTKLASGEYWTVSIVDFMVRNAKNAGSPVDTVWPSHGAVLIPTPVGVMSTSSVKPAAKKLVDYLLSMDCQKLFVKQGYIPVNGEAGSPEGAPKVSDIKVFPLNMDYISKNRTEIRDKYTGIFGAN